MSKSVSQRPMSGPRFCKSMSILGMMIHHAASVLGRHPRMIKRYRSEGAPIHVSMAMRLMETGGLSKTDAARFIQEARTRRD